MSSAIKTAFLQHPSPALISLSSLLGLGLTSAPDAILVTFLITSLRIHSQFAYRRQHSVRNHAMLWIALSITTSLAMLSPSLKALSSPGASISVLYLVSLIRNFVALGTVHISTVASSRFSSSGTSITLFPAIWATVWCLISHVSPIGRLSGWTPSTGLDRYEWLVPYFGAFTLDWVPASWAVLLSHFAGSWFMGTLYRHDDDSDDEHQEECLVEYDSAPRVHRSDTTDNQPLAFFALLLLLIIPSYAQDPLPLPPYSNSTTAFNVGCVLPRLEKSEHVRPTLNDYLTETKKYSNRAHLLLWPESAMRFDNPEDRQAGLELIRSEVQGATVAVSFEESLQDPDSPHGRKEMRRNGLAIVNSEGIHAEYFKRHLVPIAESFSLTHSGTEPAIYELPLAHPKGVKAPDWAPAPNYTRPIALSMSICLDFAFPSSFASLEARPALILGPGRTWHTSVAQAMVTQSRLRAMEMGSLVLWCDAGEESAENRALSGITGFRYSQPYQVGRGSWIKTIAIPYPFESERRTLYNQTGSIGALLAFWIVAAAFTGSNQLAGVVGTAGGKTSHLRSFPLSLWRWVRSQGHPNQHHQHDLLG